MTMTMELIHTPIMLCESAFYLNIQRGGNFLDCTFGGGGHSCYFLEHFPNIKLFALDRDPDCVAYAYELKKTFGGRFQFFNTTFSRVNELSLPPLQGIFFDLGISSIQLDNPDRGFSFRFHTPLDMRIDASKGFSAHTFLETASQQQLIEAVRDFGEEPHWRKVIAIILKYRGSDVLQYADSFAELIGNYLPKNFRENIHPATRTFQGIRIAVNRELEEIQRVLPLAFDLLAPEGRFVALSFHSLEDRIIKRFINEKTGKAIDCNEKYHMRQPMARTLTPKPIIPRQEEIMNNYRSRSTKLRALEKF